MIQTGHIRTDGENYSIKPIEEYQSQEPTNAILHIMQRIQYNSNIDDNDVKLPYYSCGTPGKSSTYSLGSNSWTIIHQSFNCFAITKLALSSFDSGS